MTGSRSFDSHIVTHSRETVIEGGFIEISKVFYGVLRASCVGTS